MNLNNMDLFRVCFLFSFFFCFHQNNIAFKKRLNKFGFLAVLLIKFVKKKYTKYSSTIKYIRKKYIDNISENTFDDNISSYCPILLFL